MATAQEKVLNLYSARHYQTDEALYSNFTNQTGIKINRIEAGENELLERIKNEGANSPADVFLTVDAARLAKADELNLFAAVNSKVLESRIPANLRANDWFAFSTRARIIVINKATVKEGEVQNYEDLADPKLKGKVCVRSGSHPYNLSLGGALIEHLGEQKTEVWAKGVVANLARAPKGGDTDQIRAAHQLLLRSAPDALHEAGRQESSGRDHRHLAEPEFLRHPRKHLRRRHAQDRAQQGIRRQVPRIPRLRSGTSLLCRRQQRVAGSEGRKDPEPGAQSPRQLQGRQHQRRSAGQESSLGTEDLRPRWLEVISLRVSLYASLGDLRLPLFYRTYNLSQWGAPAGCLLRRLEARHEEAAGCCTEQQRVATSNAASGPCSEQTAGDPY